jgi:homoserine O-succinyltransferase/O-acetyltransferase
LLYLNKVKEKLHKMKEFKIAILDMYKGEPNQGMRNIHEIIDKFGKGKKIEIYKKVYDVRNKHQIPSLDYDAYISTGGPGSPIEKEGWELGYVKFIDSVIVHNQTEENKKYIFLICHSFQVFCYHFNLGNVCLRKSESFGTFPVHKTIEAEQNYILKDLPEPFYVVDSRKWQVIMPNPSKIKKMGATILAIEKVRIHVNLERAVMAMQFTPEIIGTQFHPEANATGMIYYLRGEEKKKLVIQNYGIRKYNDMLLFLSDSKKIMLTQKVVIPSFLNKALKVKKAKAITR